MAPDTEQSSLIAPCGMNCALCSAYQAETLDLKKKGIRWTCCPGCIPRGEHCLHMRSSCEIIGNGRVRFCYECADFPCARLKRLDKRYRTKYNMSMIENLLMIREQGMEAFLSAQAAKWTCPTCGEQLITCHRNLCLRCDLEALRKNRHYRRGESS